MTDEEKPEEVSEEQTDDQSEGSTPDVPPDRLSTSPGSRYYDEDVLARGIGIRFKGKVRRNVQEYCISAGWVTLLAGKSVDRNGNPLAIKSRGPVEVWFEDLGDDPPVASAED